jgi:hypothetical protein
MEILFLHKEVESRNLIIWGFEKKRKKQRISQSLCVKFSLKLMEMGAV